MELKRITASNTHQAKALVALQMATFPEYEISRDPSFMYGRIDDTPEMHFNAVYENSVLAGFLIYWDLQDCYYIHFIAIFPEMRNQKIGQKILDWVSENLHRPVFLESEVPYNEITERRLNFYKRNGFIELANNPSILADPRREGEEGGHPLWFMGTQQVDNLDYYLTRVRDIVYYAG